MMVMMLVMMLVAMATSGGESFDNNGGETQRTQTAYSQGDLVMPFEADDVGHRGGGGGGAVCLLWWR